MKKLFTLLALATLSFTAAAHGPSPQKVEKTVVIKAAPAKVWAVVKDFGGIHKWHPAFTATKVEKKGEETFRTLSVKGGGEIYEKLRSADDKEMKLKYEIVSGIAPVADYNSFMQVTAGPGAGESTVTWVGRFYRTYKLNPPIPEGQDDATALKFVTDAYESGLANLKKVVESSK